MKKLNLLRACVIAVSTLAIGVSANAQDATGYASLSGKRPASAPAQQPSRPASTNWQVRQDSNVQQTALTKQSCGETGCGDIAFGAEGCSTGACAPGAGGSGLFGGGAMFGGGSGGAGMKAGLRGGGMLAGPARPAMGSCDSGACPPGYGQGYNRRMNRLTNRAARGAAGTGRAGLGGFWSNSSSAYQARNASLSRKLFGWLTPSGNGDQGSPPFGAYHVTYAQDPQHFDQRDGMMYGAQGYGTNITVPLAPNVRHSYNYGWGMPSSRITHLSHVAPYTMTRNLHW